MRWSIERRLTVRVAMVLLLLGIGVAIVSRNVQGRSKADSSVRLRLLTLERLEEAARLTVDLETGTRGYAITGQEEYLEPYLEARANIGGVLKAVRQLAAGNSRQNARVSSLERMLEEHLGYRDALIRAVKQRGAEEGRRLIASGRGKMEMDAMRGIIGEWHAEEERLLAWQMEEGEAAGRREAWSLVGLGGLMGTLLVGTFIELRRHLAERRRAERLLQVSEENLHVTLHSIGDGVLATDIEGRVTRLNREAERLTGWSEAEAIGRPVGEVFKIINEETRQPVPIPVEKVLKLGAVEGLANHTVLVARNGEETPIADSAAPVRCEDGRLIGVVLVFRDVAAERRAELALRTSEECLRRVTEAAPFALIVQCQGRFAYVNRAAVEMFGASEAGELLGKPILEFLHPSRREVVAERIRRLNEESAPAPPMEHRWFRLDGSEFWAEATANPTTHEGQAGAVVILRDVSQIKAAEMLADEREAQLRTVSDNLPGGAVFQAVQDGGALRFTFIGPGIESLTGVSVGEILAHPGLLNGMGFEEDAAGMKLAVQRAVEEGIPLDREVRIRSASGEVRWLQYRAAARRRTDGGIQLDGVMLDVTTRKQAEDELRRIEWLLSKGVRPPSLTRQFAAPPYGDLALLNRSRLILDAVGAGVLHGIVDDCLNLLDTSAAVHEKNGDYALGVFDSRWCKFMDLASRNLCGSVNNEEALACGKWLCHESCWGKASKVSIETGQPADIECEGGIHLYAVPIHAGGEIVGSINIGYGAPPLDPDKQSELAAKYGVSVEELRRHAEAYETRPPYIIELAKQRLQTSARLIGEIIERKRSEEALRRLNEELEHCVAERTENLREAELRYRTLFEESPDGLLVVDPETMLPLEFNERAHQILGYSPEEFARLRIIDYEVLERPEETRARIEKILLQGRADFATQHRTKSGEIRHVSVRVKKVELAGMPVLNCVFRDITERKQAEETLRAQQSRLTEAQRIGRLGDWEYDLRTDLLLWSSQVYDIFGVSPETYQPRQDDFVSHIHPEDRARYEEAGRTLFRTGEPADIDYRILLPDGRVRWVTSRAFLETNESGKPVRLYGTVQDVTERMLTLQALQASEAKFRRIVETAAEGIWNIDAESRTTYANRQMAEMLGWSVEEMMGKGLFDFMDEEGRLEAKRLVERRQLGVAEQHDFRFRTKDGKDCWTIVSTAPLFSADGEYAGALAMVTDITERKQLEDQLRQAQKLESIGRLAGGVAHDFNNLLTVINGHAELLLKELTALDPRYDSVSEILSAGQNAAALTQQLLAFSRKQIVEPKVSDLNRIVEGTSRMLGRVLGEDIALETRLQPELWRVRVDRSQFTQLLMNLAVNARDAMPDGGHLLIETSNAELDAQYASLHPDVKPGSYVQLSVSDSGVGMDEATRANIFEPFFTTKKAGTGTGLGLATVHGVVKQSGGWIWVYSEPGKGATFKIYLPRVEEACDEAAEEAAVVMLRGSETILVVEDQKELRSLVEVVLEGRGYKVLAAANAEEALLSAEDYAGPIHLLLTDVVMPGMTGRELAERLKPLRPEMRVLYMSGYTDNVIIHRGILDAGVAYLAKPFGPDALAMKVRAVLGPERAAGRILVVDDEAGVRNLLRRVLGRAGYDVLEAANGGQALERLAETQRDLVITDLVMPGQEGLETIQEVCKRHPDVKIIAMSGAFGGDYLKAAKMLGASAVLKKPIHPDDFLETVRRVLSEE